MAASAKSTDNEASPIAGMNVNERHLALISFTLLHADRDLVTSMHRRSSRWGRLLAQRDLAPETEDDIEDRLQQLGEHVLKNSPVLGRLRDRLDEVQEAIASVERVELAPLPSRIDDLAAATNVLMTSPKGPRLPIQMQGLGSRSLAELMVYRAFATELPGTEEPYSPHTVACFEEPEAHLHPQAQLAVMAIIDQMPGQHIVTTHSPQIAGEADLRQVRLFRSSDGEIMVSTPSSLSEEEMIKLRRLAERPYGQVLFSRLVIIGDGATERAALPVFARAYWGIDPAGLGVTFVDPQSLGQAHHLIKSLDDLGIPWLVFSDSDKSGLKAIKKIRTLSQESAESATDRVVTLPDGQDFEKYLVSQGFQPAIEQGIAELYGADALSQFKKDPKWRTLNDDELLIKFLDEGKKGTYGVAIADAIVSTRDKHGKPLLPELIAELLSRADSILGVNRP